MKQFAFFFLICMAAMQCAAQNAVEKQKAVKAYYSGFEKHDWNLVSSQFAVDFNFTSANNDDHISVKRFKEKCWPTNRFFKKVNFVEMTENGNELYLLVEITTTDYKVVRNVDLFKFSGGKIKSIETFFGKGESYPGKK